MGNYQQQIPGQDSLEPHQEHMQHQAMQPMQPHYTQGQNVLSQGWQNRLMDCSPCETCLLGTFLPCLLIGQTSERMRDPSMETYEAFNTDCLLLCGISWLTGCGWIYVMMKRSQIREGYGIKGDGMSDCCSTYFCACCALIQQEKEVKARTASRPIVQAYTSPKEGMQMPR